MQRASMVDEVVLARPADVAAAAAAIATDPGDPRSLRSLVLAAYEADGARLFLRSRTVAALVHERTTGLVLQVRGIPCVQGCRCLAEFRVVGP